MRAPAVRLVASWLRDHPEHGVNAQLGAVPLLTGARAAPAVVSWLESTTHEAAALGMVPDDTDLPALIISPNDEAVTMLNPATLTGPRDYLVPILVRYVTRIGEDAVAPDAAVAETDTDTTMRAVVRSLIRLCRVGTSADKETAGVALWSLADLSLNSIWDAKGDVASTGGVVARFRVRDSHVE